MFKASYFGDENSRAHKRWVKFADKRRQYEGNFFGVERELRHMQGQLAHILYSEREAYAKLEVPRVFRAPFPIIGFAEELMDHGIIDAEAARKLLSEPVDAFLVEVDTWELAPKCNCLGINGHSSWCNAAPQVAPGEVAGEPGVAPQTRK